MNIITVPYNSKGYFVRPDTSLNKDSNDYFCPDNITELAVASFIFVRASKAGKSVSAKFASRYYTTYGTGFRLWAPGMIDSSAPESWWMANSLDNSTFITEEGLPADQIPQEMAKKIDAAIEAASSLVSFRTGDYIAVDLQDCGTLASPAAQFTCNGKTINIIW